MGQLYFIVFIFFFRFWKIRKCCACRRERSVRDGEEAINKMRANRRGGVSVVFSMSTLMCTHNLWPQPGVEQLDALPLGIRRNHIHIHNALCCTLSTLLRKSMPIRFRVQCGLLIRPRYRGHVTVVYTAYDLSWCAFTIWIWIDLFCVRELGMLLGDYYETCSMVSLAGKICK